MLSKKNSYHFLVEKNLVKQFGGDLALALWYSALKDYARRFKPDKAGYVRISRSLIEQDLGLSRSQIRTLNAKLVAAGLLRVDGTSHGGRAYAGYKLT